MRLRKLHLLIAVVPMIACEVMIVQKLLIILPIAGTNPVFVARHLAIMFGFLTLMSLIHWLGLEITYHRRIPNPVRFIHSYYSTWRALAAWLSPTPDIDHPGVFRFQQPWTNDEVRRQLVAIALAINAAIVVSAIANWGEQVFRPSEQMAVAASAEAEYVAPSRFERLLFVATFPEFLLTALVASVIVPPLLFFVSLHCIWGPTFETFNERFECFRFTAKAPVLIGAGDSKHL